LNSNDTNRSGSNDSEDTGFDVSDFDDFAKQLDNSLDDNNNDNNTNSNSNQKLEYEAEKEKKDAYLLLLEEFILTYQRGLYFNQLKTIIQDKRKSITVDYNHIIDFSDQLAEYLLTEPRAFINSFKATLYHIDTEQNLDYFKDKKYFNIRLTNYPIREKIKNIDVDQRNKMLCMRGNISKASDKKPYIWRYCLKCPDCSNILYSDYDERDCPVCDKHPTMKKDKDNHIYTNCVYIKIQELSEDLEGRTPQSIDCIVLGDIVDDIKPGIKATITGFVLLRETNRATNPRSPFLVSVLINNIEPFTSNDLNLIKKIYLTDKEEKKFMELAQDPNWIDTLIGSFAPHIYGLENIKLGIILSIVGSGEIPIEGTDIRSRIHILICGDPSLAKTKLLKFTHKIVLGSISAIGKGASGGGLTAVVSKETDGTFTVQPGAIVFANKSLFLFDESDKVTDDVRSHLHESMEDGTVTVTKGGQIVTLQAESTTLFAANPKFSRYQDSLSIAENINLPHSLISRFDLVYVIRDNTTNDQAITEHLNYIYTNRKIPNQESLLTVEDLTKYFLFVKTQDIDPEFDDDAIKLLQSFYFEMRAKSTPDAIATTTRQYEGLLRMCRSLSRGTLQRRVRKYHAERIVNLIRSQFDSVMREADGTYNVGLMEGKTKAKLEGTKLMIKLMNDLEKEYNKNKIPIIAIVEKLMEDPSYTTKKKAYAFIDQMNDENVISNNGEGFVRFSKYT
jgi:replicative DNA helicase Mcm